MNQTAAAPPSGDDEERFADSHVCSFLHTLPWSLRFSVTSVVIHFSTSINISHIYYFLFTEGFIYLLLERGEGREKEENIHWLPLTHPQLGAWPATQARALTWNQTSDLSVGRMTPSHWASPARAQWLVLACALTGDGTRNLGVSGRRSNQLSYLARATSRKFRNKILGTETTNCPTIPVLPSLITEPPMLTVLVETLAAGCGTGLSQADRNKCAVRPWEGEGCPFLLTHMWFDG